MTMAAHPDMAAEDAGVDLRLADLRVVGGEPLVRRILGRFEQHLVDALDEGAPAWTPAFAHRTAGLAGMIGFERLAAACRALELVATQDGARVDDALAAAAETVGRVRERLSRPD
jgi:HPt (histidine-containing phosphotransfer) domain-containing protein